MPAGWLTMLSWAALAAGFAGTAWILLDIYGRGHRQPIATVAGLTLGAEYVGDYLAAIVLGIVFQYFAVAPMRGLSVRRGLIEAAKADVVSLTAFEIGLFGWMALMTFVFFPAPHLRPDSPVYWFCMQIGMVAGFFPVVLALTAAGVGAGTAGALLITLPALSVPSMIMVGRAVLAGDPRDGGRGDGGRPDRRAPALDPVVTGLMVRGEPRPAASHSRRTPGGVEAVRGRPRRCCSGAVGRSRTHRTR